MRLVRAMRSGEELLLRGIFHRAVHGSTGEHYSPLQRDAWAPEQFDEVLWVERMQKLGCMVAEVDGQLAGFCDVQEDGYIDMFFVDPAFGRKGVGSLLMAAIHQRGLARLYSRVSLTAQPFFARHGFQIAERRTVFVRGATLENALMTKTAVPHSHSCQSGQHDSASF